MAPFFLLQLYRDSLAEVNEYFEMWTARASGRKREGDDKLTCAGIFSKQDTFSWAWLPV